MSRIYFDASHINKTMKFKTSKYNLMNLEITGNITKLGTNGAEEHILAHYLGTWVDFFSFEFIDL